MRLLRRRVLLVALPLVLAAGVALAAQPSARRPSSAVINACVKKKSGLVRVVASLNACKRAESPLSWNVQGPAGARGATGLPGQPDPPVPPALPEPRVRKVTPEPGARRAPQAHPGLPASAEPPVRRVQPAHRSHPSRA